MENIQSNLPEIITNQVIDDFKCIRGIGPRFESQLHKAGILTYTQLSILSSDELAGLFKDFNGISAERIAQQNWTGQARKLAAEKTPSEANIEPAPLEGRLHYAVFTVELLLDEENNVRRTRVMHVQNQSEVTWAGWEEPKLVNFFIESAQLKIPQPRKSVKPDMPHDEAAEPVPAETREPKPTPQIPAIRGKLHLDEMALMATGTGLSQRLIQSDQPFDVKLLLNLANVTISHDVPLNYAATIYAKRIGSGSNQVVGRAEGMFLPEDFISLAVEGIRLPHGTYRIEAFVKLTPTREMAAPSSGLMAMAEGGLLQIY
jgi:hypothetical protein